MQYLTLLWLRWKIVAEKIGGFQTNVLFSILYFLMIVPVGLVVRLSTDYLGLRSFPKWSDYMKSEKMIKELRSQF